jgi:hypothetical protein
MLASSASPLHEGERIEVRGFETTQSDRTERTLTFPLSLTKGEATHTHPLPAFLLS